MECTEEREPDFAAFVGIDWADRKHAWALQVEGAPPEHGYLDHTPEAVDVWATELAERFGGRPVAVALEQSRGALLICLASGQRYLNEQLPRSGSNVCE